VVIRPDPSPGSSGAARQPRILKPEKHRIRSRQRAAVNLPIDSQRKAIEQHEIRDLKHVVWQTAVHVATQYWEKVF